MMEPRIALMATGLYPFGRQFYGVTHPTFFPTISQAFHDYTAGFPIIKKMQVGSQTGQANIDELVKSHILDGFVKAPRSRLANPEEGGVLSVRRTDEGYG
jgi:hypothetical protein